MKTISEMFIGLFDVLYRKSVVNFTCNHPTRLYDLALCHVSSWYNAIFWEQTHEFIVENESDVNLKPWRTHRIFILLIINTYTTAWRSIKFKCFCSNKNHIRRKINTDCLKPQCVLAALHISRANPLGQGIQDTREQMLTTHSKTQQILRYHFQKTYEEELQNIHTSIDTKKGSTEFHLHIGMQFTFQHRLKMLPTPTNPIEIFTSHTTRLRMPLLSMQFF